MSDNSRIEWTDATWNPITGCTKVSPGCDNCYAERVTERFHGKGSFTTIQLHPGRLDQPLRWRRPRMVFVNSMSDLFHDDIPTSYIAEVFAVLALAEKHTFQLLTKRHARMRNLLNSNSFMQTVQSYAVPLAGEYGINTTWAERATDPSAWPLLNLWLGVSVENQKWADVRIPALLETPAAVRWLSCEPLLGPVDLLPYLSHQCDCPGPGHNRLSEYGPRPDWIVVGGESGPGARPMHPDWARGLRDQCVKFDIPFFFKQWGESLPLIGHREYLDLPPAKGNRDWSRPFGDDVTMCRVGKKAAGRLLDGKAWDEYPAGAR